MERKHRSTHPAIVATNISPSASGFNGALSYSASEAMLKAPQDIAMHAAGPKYLFEGVRSSGVRH